MKRFNHLYAQITSFENLLLAAQKAQKGKRQRVDVAAFHLKQEENLLRLQEELQTKTYCAGDYRTFYIQDPKKRMISAAPYRDRVVHHALCNVIESLFERTFIFDSYANRKGKGTHKALDRYQYFARIYPYVLKCDLKKFFPSIDHAILKSEIERKIKCRDTLSLIHAIIANSNPQEPHLHWFEGDDLFAPLQRKRGLPIGNLTSQFWGNVYLNRFDHFIKEDLRVRAYIRYVDDFVLFSKNKAQLWHWKDELTHYLAQLRLLPHPNKTQIHQVNNGVPFLGFRVFPFHRYIRKEKVRRYKRYLKRNLKLKDQGLLVPQNLEDQLNAWLGHIRQGHCQRLEYEIFWYLRRYGVELYRHPRGSWRVLEQQ